MEGQEFNTLKRRVTELERILTLHTHSGSDKTKVIGEGNIVLKKGKLIKLAKTFYGYDSLYEGLSNEVSRMLLIAGLDEKIGYGYKSENSQMELDHAEGGLSFFYGFRPPLASGPSTGTISIVSGQNTITDPHQTFATNELAGCYISVVGTTSGTLETHLVASNTATVITIATTWGISEGVGYVVFVPMYLGAANYPFQRLYLIGDLRFGRGASAGANVIYIKHGAGSPEGSVTANVGSLYLRTDGGANTTLYVKESGTGNTGWSAV